MRRMYSKPQLLEAVESEAKLNGIKVFEDIKDKDGHLRFVEGNGTPETISGFTSSYCKWSLSGTHLIFVLAGTFADTTALVNIDLALYQVPEWVYNKIYGVWQTNWIETKKTVLINDDWSTQDATTSIRKGSDNNLIIRFVGSTTMTKDRNFRVQFDLLIDND